MLINFWFLVNNFSLLWPINTKLAVWVAYFMTQLGIATQVSVIKVKVTVTKNRNSVFKSISDPNLGSLVDYWLYRSIIEQP